MAEPTQKSGPPPHQPRTPDLSAMNSLPLLVSPPGMDAPIHLANYTPDLGLMHPAGTVSPRGMLQITPIGPKHLNGLKSAFDRYMNRGKESEVRAAPEKKAPEPKAKPPRLPKPPTLRKSRVPAPKLRPPKVGL